MDADFIQRMLLAAPVIIFSLTVHEYFHAYSAYKLGDSTAKDMGRLTLNPLAHLDLMGTMMMFISQFRFGWAKPVPVNPYNLRNYRRDDLIISAAGPLSNIGLAIIAGFIIRIVILGNFQIPQPILQMIFLGVQINVFLAVFNLLPVFPLDGSHIFRGLLPEKYGPVLDKIDRVAPMVLFGLIIFGWISRTPILFYIIGPIAKPLIYLFSGVG